MWEYGPIWSYLCKYSSPENNFQNGMSWEMTAVNGQLNEPKVNEEFRDRRILSLQWFCMNGTGGTGLEMGGQSGPLLSDKEDALNISQHHHHHHYPPHFSYHQKLSSSQMISLRRSEQAKVPLFIKRQNKLALFIAQSFTIQFWRCYLSEKSSKGSFGRALRFSQVDLKVYSFRPISDLRCSLLNCQQVHSCR